LVTAASATVARRRAALAALALTTSGAFISDEEMLFG
jgi:hypothetical protein